MPDSLLVLGEVGEGRCLKHLSRGGREGFLPTVSCHGMWVGRASRSTVVSAEVLTGHRFFLPRIWNCHIQTISLEGMCHSYMKAGDSLTFDVKVCVYVCMCNDPNAHIYVKLID